MIVTAPVLAVVSAAMVKVVLSLRRKPTAGPDNAMPRTASTMSSPGQGCKSRAVTVVEPPASLMVGFDSCTTTCGALPTNVVPSVMATNGTNGVAGVEFPRASR